MKSVKRIVVFIFVMVSNWAIAQSGYQVGDKIDRFKLKNVDGNMVSLDDYKDSKGLIVTFTCNTCPYAQLYEQRIMALDKQYAPKGYPVVAIMPNNPKVKPGDSFEAMQKRANDMGYTFPYLIDAGQTVYPKFGATKTPHTYVVENTKKGFVVRYIGAIDDNYQDASAVKQKYVEAAVNALLNGRSVSISETKAIGCTIKV